MAADAQNPFLAQNPFMAPAPEPPLPVPMAPTCGDPTCTRKHRPANSPRPGDHYSPDLSERMLQLQEDGKAGGQFGHLSAGRSKDRKRAAEVVADFAAERAQDIKKVWADGIDETQPISIRMAAAKEIVKIEDNEENRRFLERQQAFNELSKGELIDGILEDLQALTRAGEIADGIVDATVVEDDGSDG